MTRSLALAALAAAVLAGAGCGSPCEDLATRICHCQPAGTIRDTCVQTVKNQVGRDATKPTQAQEQFCASRLATCKDPADDSTQCDRLKTPQGKVDCGLAFP
jgi:hypothetical protein